MTLLSHLMKFFFKLKKFGEKIKKRINKVEDKSREEDEMSFLPKDIFERYQFLVNPTGPAPAPPAIHTATDEETKAFLLNAYSALPKVPQVLFGNDSIDKFFIIRYEIQKLKAYQRIIMNTIESLKYDFETTYVESIKYNITPNSDLNVFTMKDLQYQPKILLQKLFFDETTRFSDFNIFIQFYEQSFYHLFHFQGNNSKQPFYYKIIKDNYQGKPKVFILQMLKDYIQTTKMLQKLYKQYWGILSYSSIFDISQKPKIELFQNMKSKYKNDFNLNFHNDKIYNETSMNTSGNTNIPTPTESSNFFMLDFETNMYEQTGNETLYQQELINHLRLSMTDMCENLKKIYQSRKMNLYQLFIHSFQLDIATQEFIFYFMKPKLFTQSLEQKDKIYSYINARIDVYNTFIDEFMEWFVKAKMISTGQRIEPPSFFGQDKRLSEVYKDFNEFFQELFNIPSANRLEKVKERLKEKYGIIVETPSNASGVNNISNEEYQALQDLIAKLNTILKED